jgi:hypothetical protein
LMHQKLLFHLNTIFFYYKKAAGAGKLAPTIISPLWYYCKGVIA